MGKNTFKKSLLKRDDQISGSVIEGFTKSDNLLRSYITRDLGGLAYTLYMTLLSHRNTDTGECFPSAQLLASEIGKTRQYVFKLLSQLEELNYIEIDSGNSKESNHYYFPGEDFYKGIITGPNTSTPNTSASKEDTEAKNDSNTSATKEAKRSTSKKKTSSANNDDAHSAIDINNTSDNIIPLEAKVKTQAKTAAAATPTPIAASNTSVPKAKTKRIDLDDLEDFEF